MQLRNKQEEGVASSARKRDKRVKSGWGEDEGFRTVHIEDFAA